MIPGTIRAALPQDLQQEFDSLARGGFTAIRERNFLHARATFKLLYEILVDRQSAGQSYHKGLPLHNWGVAMLLYLEPLEALKLFLLAYAEDVLTAAYDLEDEADDMPAGQAIRLVYQVRDDLTTAIKKFARDGKRRGGYVPGDPQLILTAALNVVGCRIEEAASTMPELAKRSANNLESLWEKRLFVGGSYASQFAVLNEIKKEVMRWGYDPILASEFDMPPDLIHHHTLMLLHNCEFAIFDISSEAGQLLEVERLRDYEIEPLFVYQRHPDHSEPRISAMLATLIRQRGYETKSYSDIQQVRDHVKAYLEPYFERVDVPST